MQPQKVPHAHADGGDVLKEQACAPDTLHRQQKCGMRQDAHADAPAPRVAGEASLSAAPGPAACDKAMRTASKRARKHEKASQELAADEAAASVDMQAIAAQQAKVEAPKAAAKVSAEQEALSAQHRSVRDVSEAVEERTKPDNEGEAVIRAQHKAASKAGRAADRAYQGRAQRRAASRAARAAACNADAAADQADGNLGLGGAAEQQPAPDAAAVCVSSRIDDQPGTSKQQQQQSPSQPPSALMTPAQDLLKAGGAGAPLLAGGPAHQAPQQQAGSKAAGHGQQQSDGSNHAHTDAQALRMAGEASLQAGDGTGGKARKRTREEAELEAAEAEYEHAAAVARGAEQEAAAKRAKLEALQTAARLRAESLALMAQRKAARKLSKAADMAEERKDEGEAVLRAQRKAARKAEQATDRAEEREAQRRAEERAERAAAREAERTADKAARKAARKGVAAEAQQAPDAAAAHVSSDSEGQAGTSQQQQQQRPQAPAVLLIPAQPGLEAWDALVPRPAAGPAHEAGQAVRSASRLPKTSRAQRTGSLSVRAEPGGGAPSNRQLEQERGRVAHQAAPAALRAAHGAGRGTKAVHIKEEEELNSDGVEGVDGDEGVLPASYDDSGPSDEARNIKSEGGDDGIEGEAGEEVGGGLMRRWLPQGCVAAHDLRLGPEQDVDRAGCGLARRGLSTSRAPTGVPGAQWLIVQPNTQSGQRRRGKQQAGGPAVPVHPAVAEGRPVRVPVTHYVIKALASLPKQQGTLKDIFDAIAADPDAAPHLDNTFSKRPSKGNVQAHDRCYTKWQESVVSAISKKCIKNQGNLPIVVIETVPDKVYGLDPHAHAQV